MQSQSPMQKIREAAAKLQKLLDTPWDAGINWNKVDTETREAEDNEVLNENKWDEHKERCSGCALCEI